MEKTWTKYEQIIKEAIKFDMIKELMQKSLDNEEKLRQIDVIIWL